MGPKDDRYVDLEAGAVKGSFRDGLCQCCYDLGSCCCALVGGMPCLLGQLYEKVVGCRCSCCAIVFVYYGLMAAGFALLYYGSSAYVAALKALIAESGPASLYEQIMKGALLPPNQATLTLPPSTCPTPRIGPRTTTPCGCEQAAGSVT